MVNSRRLLSRRNLNLDQKKKEGRERKAMQGATPGTKRRGSTPPMLEGLSDAVVNRTEVEERGKGSRNLETGTVLDKRIWNRQSWGNPRLRVISDKFHAAEETGESRVLKRRMGQRGLKNGGGGFT